MSKYFLKPKSCGWKLKVELYGLDTSKLFKKVDLESLKSEIDKLDIDR